jgi:hypothetical protein
MKKTFTLFTGLLFFATIQAQLIQNCFTEDFTLQTSGWTYSNGASEGTYNNPLTNCSVNRGIITPGVGGNNPANVMTPTFTSNGALSVGVSFKIFVFNANLNCNTYKNYDCPTSVDVFYWVGTTRFNGIVDMALPTNGPNGDPNVSVLFPVGSNLPAGTNYRIELAFKPKSGSGNCNQPGTKYVLDDFSRCEVNCTNCVIDAVEDNFCGQAGTSNVFSGTLANNDTKYTGAIVTYTLVNGPFANNSSTIGGATLVVNADGTFTLTRTDFTKSVFDFTYRITDQFGQTDLATARVCFATGGPLPVKLIAFQAKRNQGQIDLTWATNQEINASHFTVERNTGRQFEAIGSVQAMNNERGASYRFSDMQGNFSETAQYRLQMVDLDGKQAFSEIRVVNGTRKSGQISIFPNPVSAGAFVQLSDMSGMIQIRIADQSGRIVKQLNQVTVNRFSTEGLGKGVYQVQLFDQNGIVSTQKLMVQ